MLSPTPQAAHGMVVASSALLAELFAHATRPEFVYTHQWRPRDLVMWDNACVVHSATWYDPAYIRHMHRTTVAGPEIE